MSKSGFTIDEEKLPQELDRIEIKKFTSGAHYNSQPQCNEQDWQNKDPESLPTHNFRLRLNDYQIGLLKAVAKKQSRSASNLLKLILIEQLRKMNKE